MPAMRLLGRIGRRPRDSHRDGAGPNTKIGYLTDTDLFRGLDDAEMDEVARMTTMTTCKSGRVFYTPGESGEVLFILKKGSVQLYRIAPDGKRLVIGALRAGAVFGEMGLIGQGMYDTFAEASEDCTLCVMSRSDVEMLVASKPAFAIGLLELMVSACRTSNRRWNASHFAAWRRDSHRSCSLCATRTTKCAASRTRTSRTASARTAKRRHVPSTIFAAPASSRWGGSGSTSWMSRGSRRRPTKPGHSRTSQIWLNPKKSK